MSGFEPLALASAAGETAGTAALAAEVAAPDFLATVGGMEFGTPALFSGLEGMGAAGLGGLTSLYGGAAQIPSASGLLSGISPEATAQISNAIANAAPGANQIPTLYGSNLPAQIPTYAAQSNFGDIVPSAAAPSTPTMADAIEQQRIAEAYKTAQDIGMKPPSSGGLMDAIKSMGSKVGQWWDQKKPEEQLLYGGAGLLAANALLGKKSGLPEREPYSGPLSKFKYDPSQYTPSTLVPPTPYTPVYKDYRRYAGGGPIEAMSNANAVGANTGYPMANINKGAYATPWQTPISRSVLSDSADTGVNPMTGEMTNFAGGGISDLGGYSDGGRMLKGPGDGMSDDIPATIAGKQPARLANEEFVVPADVVSHLGNGSSDAGAKVLYKMMDRVRQARTGTKKQGKQINPEKYLA